jgi:hypothetical protein
MDWLPWIWQYDACYDRVPEARLAESASSTVGPTTLDRWLIKMIYRTVAPESRCEKCGEDLGRRLRVLLPAEPYSVWDVLVVTRCRGWRGHRHVATVSCAGGALQLGPLRLERRVRSRKDESCDSNPWP